MDFRYQAAIARAFGRFVEQGLVYKGKKPVHWCIHCRTALAEAEVEYADHSSPSIYVEFPLAPGSADELATRVPGARRPGRLGPDLDDDAVDDSVESGDRVSSRARLRRVRRGRPGGHRRRGARGGGVAGRRPSARSADRAHEGRAARRRSLPPSAVRARFDRRARRLRHARRRHRRGPHRARPRRRRLQHRHEVRSGDLRADRTGRTFSRHGRALRRHARVRRESEGRRGAQGARPAVASGGVLAPVSALLAVPQPGDLPGDVAVVHPPGRRSAEAGHDRARRARPIDRPSRGTLAVDAAVQPTRADAARSGHRRRRSSRQVDAGVGPRPHLQHDREPPRLVHLAPARVGRADSGGRLHGVRRGDHDAGARRAEPPACSTRTAPTPGTSGRPRSSSRPA